MTFQRDDLLDREDEPREDRPRNTHTSGQYFTPGPWLPRFDAVTGHGRERAVVESEDARFQLADCGFASSRVAVANARLMAAAPNLLAACKHAVRLMDTMANTQATKILLRAIAKAEGHEP